MAAETVHIEGLRELQRAFKLADKELAKDLRATLRQIATPVQHDAERLAAASIPRIGLPWSRMRVGVTQSSVYVAPKQRGTRGRGPKHRPNLFDLLMGRSLEPALQQNQALVVHEVERMLGTIGHDWERL